jgi:hypothetical protein
MKGADVKITLVFLAAYAIVGTFHSYRDMSISRMSGPTSGSQSYSHPIRRARCAAYYIEQHVSP